MSKLEHIASTKAALTISGGSLAWPFVVPSPDQYASFLNLIVVPTIGALIALITLLIKARQFWRGRAAAFHEDESGAVSKRGIGLIVGGVLTATLATGQWAYTSAWEGYENCVYLDSGGYPTVGVGHMDPSLKVGECYSDAQIEAWFWQDMEMKVDRPLSRCITNESLSEATVTAVRDWTFNVGGGAACRSTLVRLLNAGQVREACEQLPRWVYVKGMLLRGLENRRWRGLPGMPLSNRALCLSGLQ
ncbi:MAG: hypothetical protein EP336_12360 [Rhodobacteraceae bacterium]|nr:MAG: hypothetical protein EP336_12360 [Paracoccaceae bacterium]